MAPPHIASSVDHVVLGATFTRPTSSTGCSRFRSSFVVGGKAASFVDVVTFKVDVHGLGIPSVDRPIFSLIVNPVSVSNPIWLVLDYVIADEIALTVEEFSRRATIFRFCAF